MSQGRQSTRFAAAGQELVVGYDSCQYCIPPHEGNAQHQVVSRLMHTRNSLVHTSDWH